MGQVTYAKSIRNPSTRPYPLSRDEVARLYYEEHLPLPEVASIAGTSRQCLARWMEYWKLPRRAGAEGLSMYRDKRRRSRSPNWEGGAWQNRSTGVWFTYAPNHPRQVSGGVVPTHILVAEARIGRYLRAGEVVHHLDGDRSNKDPENLCVMLNREHLILHRLLGCVGIAVLTEGRIEEVLRLIQDEARRSFVQYVYAERLPCVSGFLDAGASSARVPQQTRSLDYPEVSR